MGMKRPGEGLSDRLMEGHISLERFCHDLGMHDLGRGGLCYQD